MAVQMESVVSEKSTFHGESAKLYEMRVHKGVMRGMSDCIRGKTISKEELKHRIFEKRFED